MLQATDENPLETENPDENDVSRRNPEPTHAANRSLSVGACPNPFESTFDTTTTCIDDGSSSMNNVISYQELCGSSGSFTEETESDVQVRVDRPEKVLATLDTYITYRVVTKCNLPGFTQPEHHVRRRYSDFVWIRQRLELQYPFAVLPALPEKHSVYSLDRYDPDFIKFRCMALHLFVSWLVKRDALPSNPGALLGYQASFPKTIQFPGNLVQLPDTSGNSQLPSNISQLPSNGGQLPSNGVPLLSDTEHLLGNHSQLPSNRHSLQSNHDQLLSNNDVINFLRIKNPDEWSAYRKSKVQTTKVPTPSSNGVSLAQQCLSSHDQSDTFKSESEYCSNLTAILNSLEKMALKLLKSEQEYCKDLEAMRMVFNYFAESESESGFKSVVAATAQALATDVTCLTSTNQRLEPHFVVPCHQMALYSEAVRAVLRKRDTVDLEHKSALDNLHKRKSEYDLTLRDRSKSKDADAKLSKLDLQIKEASQKVDKCKANLHNANSQVQSELLLWCKIKEAELRRIISTMASHRVDMHRKSLSAWEDATTKSSM